MRLKRDIRIICKIFFILSSKFQQFIANLKSHIFIFCNQRLSVDDPELLKLNTRLSVQSLIIADSSPILAICQDYYAFGVEVKFTRMWDFDLKVRSSRPKMESNTKSITSRFNLTHFWNFVFN